MAGRLVVLDRAGRAKSKSFALSSGMCTLGRSAACDIRVLLADVSPHHATVTVHANQTVVRNVGSGNTLVNGAPVSVCALQHGDELALGGRRLRWEYDAPQAPRRTKTQPALAVPTAAGRAARRGTLAAPPRAPDRDVQLALELRHRSSMPASSGTGGKQVAIVQPQRRNTENQNGGVAESSLRLEPSPRPAPAPQAADRARLHTPTKATLWIESRRGRRAASLNAGAPLRLLALRNALTPGPRRARLNVTKIQAPLHIDHTKRAAIMLMTGHTPKSKLPSPKNVRARTPSFVAKKRSPAARTPKGRGSINATNKSRNTATPQTLDPEKSARKSNTRNSGKRSVSVLEITDSESSRRSPALPNPRKSALKSSGQRTRKTESIKFDLSNLENHAQDESDILMVSSTNGDATEDLTLRYSSSPPSPSPRRSIHSRSSRMLESLGSPMRSPASTKTVESPASPRSLKSARGSIIVQKALESSDTFVTESQYSHRQTGSPRRRDLEAYSVVDLVSLDSDTSRSVYGSAGSPSRSALLGSSTPLANRTALTLTTPENAPRAPSQSTRLSRGARSRSRLDDSTRTVDSMDDDSPKSSRKVKSAIKRSLDDSFPESPQTYISLDSSRKSLGNTSTTAKRGSRSRFDNSDSSLLESPNDISLVSMKQSLGRKLCESKRVSRSLNASISPTPKDISLVAMKKSLGKKLSSSNRGSRLDDSTQVESPKEQASPNASRRSQQTLPTTKRVSRSLDYSNEVGPKGVISPNSSSAIKRESGSLIGNSIFSESPKNTSTKSSRNSLRNALSTTKRSSRGQVDANITSSSGKTSSKRDSSVVESPKNVSANSSRKSLEKTSILKRSSRTKLSIVFSPKPVAFEFPKDQISANSTRNSVGKIASTSNRVSRSKLIDSALNSPVANALVNSTRASTIKALSTSKRDSRRKLVDSPFSSPKPSLANSTRKSVGKTPSLLLSSISGCTQIVDSSTRSPNVSQAIDGVLSSPSPSKTDALANSTRKSKGKTPSTSKRGSRSKLIDSVLSSSSIADALANSTRKSVGKASSTSKRGRSEVVDSVLGSPIPSNTDALANSTRKSIGKTPSTSKRGSRSKLIDSVLSSSSIADALANSTRKSVGKASSTSKRGRSELVDSVLASPIPSDTEALANSTRKSIGKTPSTSKRGSRSKLIDSVLSSTQNADVLANSSRKSVGKTLSTSKRGTRQLIDSALSSPSPSRANALADSTRKSVGKLSASKRSRSQLEENVAIEFPNDLQTSRKSRETIPSTLTRRTRSLPLESPKDTSRDISRKSRVSAISTTSRNTRGPNTSLKESPLNTSPAKSPKTPTSSPKSPNVSSKTKNLSKTLTLSISRVDNNVSTGGEITPEERGSPEDAGTPVLSIRSLLDASVSYSPREPSRKRGRPSDKRKTFANARDAVRNRGSIRSKSLIFNRDIGDVTPTGIAEPTPEAVKSKHSSAKKSRSRRSIIDTLDDSGLVKHLFNSPVKRKLSQSMSEFSRRLEEPEANTNVSGVTKLTRNSPKNDVKNLHGGRQRTSRARRSIKNDLTDVRGVKVMFAAAPRDSFGDVRGVKRAFQASPNDDLRRVSGVKNLFQSKKPRDDLTDVRGVRELFKRGQKDELNATGVKQGLQVRSPKNDLRDVRGVKKLFQQSKAQTSPNVSGVSRLLDEPTQAEVMFDRLVGKPPIRATYSKTFIARSAKKPAKRRRTTSLSVPVDDPANNVEGWLEKELQKRVSNKSVARALQLLTTDTVAGGTPIIASRSRNSVAPRRSAAENYAEHTLPIKKRSLEKAPEPRSAKKRSLPLKKRALVHSTPVKGRASRAADVTLARMSPIACEPAVAIEETVRGSPTVSRNSPKKPRLSKAPEAENVVEKNETVKPSPKKTRAKRTEEVANNQRATRARGEKKANPKIATPKKALVAKKVPEAKAPTPKQTPKKAPITKVPTKVAPKEPRPNISRSKKVTTPTEVATPQSPVPKKTTRSKKVPTPAKVTPKKSPTPKKATRGRKVPTPKKAATPRATRTKKVPTPTEVTPKKSPTPKKATRGRKVPTPKKAATPRATRTKKVPTPTEVTPKKSPTPKKATRGKKILTPVKTATPKKPTVVVKKPRAVVATATPKATRGKKTLKSPVVKSPAKHPRSKKTQSPVTAPVEKRSRKQAAPKAVTPQKRGRSSAPAKKAIRASLVLPKPSPILKPRPAARAKRSKNDPPKESPKKSPARGKNAAAGDAPEAKPTRGRKAALTQQKGNRAVSASPVKKATPASEKKGKAPPAPKRGRRAPPTPKEKALTPKRKKAEDPSTPEPRRKKNEVGPEPKRAAGRKAAASPGAKKKDAKAVATPKKKESKAVPTPEPKGKGRKADSKALEEEPVTKRGRKAAQEPVRSPPASRGRSAKRAEAAPNEAAKPIGKKAAAVAVEESAPRGQKRKNGTASVDKKKEPSPKKPRSTRAPVPPAGAAPRARRR